MRRAFEIAVVAVATLGIVSVGFAGCCPSDDDRCGHGRQERSTDAPQAAGHCAPAPASSSPSLESGCCGDATDAAPDYGLAKPPPLPGAPATRAATPLIAASDSDAAHPAPAVARAPDQRSPILRL